jgi:hypothetical protein
VTETQTVDLAAWLTAVWDEEERLATYALGRPWLKTKLYPDEPWHFLPLYQPELALARIAADRKILDLHTGENDAECQIGNYVYETCATLKALASPYKGREGWQENWDE